jgi:hypothetical protein
LFQTVCVMAIELRFESGSSLFSMRTQKDTKMF